MEIPAGAFVTSFDEELVETPDDELPVAPSDELLEAPWDELLLLESPWDELLEVPWDELLEAPDEEPVEPLWDHAIGAQSNTTAVKMGPSCRFISSSPSSRVFSYDQGTTSVSRG